MKKWVLTIFLSAGIAFTSLADEGRGSCVVNGTADDYVEVTAYSEGKGSGSFVIANSASKPLMSLYIVITAEVTKVGSNTYEPKTLYRGNYIGKVDSYSSQKVDFTYSGTYSNIRNIAVSVDNPTCK